MGKKTPLYDEHIKLNARMVEFGGYEMPIQYSSILEEHMAVRTTAGIFDVSHMGEIMVEGTGAERFLNGLLTNDIQSIKVGKVQYNIMTSEDGGTIDDLIVYKEDEGRFMLVVNAANKDKDLDHLKAHISNEVSVKDVSDDLALIAVQGPRSLELVEKFLPGSSSLSKFSFEQRQGEQTQLIISRTGYTGEDGFEVYGSPEVIRGLFNQFVSSGATPCGLGARDTLRFEAGLPLYGHELSPEITPVEAGLGRFIKFNKDFVGKDALQRQAAENSDKRIIGLRLLQKGVPRQGYRVYHDGEDVGFVTTGNYCPYVKEYLAMALVDAQKSCDKFEIGIRGRKLAAQKVSKNFLKLVR
jgi:aminomethyltransferase